MRARLTAVVLAAAFIFVTACTGGFAGPQPIRLTIDIRGTGAGHVGSTHNGALSTGCSTNSPPPCATNYAANSSVTLTATADPGSDFTGWSGTASDCNAPATQAAITVVMDRNKTCAATFDTQPQITVLLTGTGTGRVTSSPAGIDCPGTCSQLVPKGSVVFLTASAGSTSGFTGWSGCINSANLQVSVAFSVNATCTAQFDQTVVISDDFDDAGALARWDIALRYEDPGTTTAESNPASGGSSLGGGIPSSGYRQGVHSFTQYGVTRVDHILRGDATHPGTYDPAAPGAGPVNYLVVSMDRLVIHAPNVGAQVGTFFALRQGTQVFHAPIDPGGFFNNLIWLRVTATIRATDFVNGTPNFNAPMEFGFRRSVTASGGSLPLFLSWGTDNFRVEVHR